MTQPTITVYSKPSCVQCNATYRWLDDAGLKGQYPVVDLTEDPEALAYVKSLGYLGAPVVVTDDDHWAGFDPARLDKYIARAKAAPAEEKEIA